MSQELAAPVKHRFPARVWGLIVAGSGLVVFGVLALAYLFWLEAGASYLAGGFESAIPLAVDYPAPKLRLLDLQGRPVSLADHAGQVVLVNNWAYWCPPCRAELPILERNYQDHQDQKFIISIGAIIDGSKSKLARKVNF